MFLFACLTLVLSSMQVGLAAQPIRLGVEGKNSEGAAEAWTLLPQVSMWFAVIVVVGIVCIAFCAVAGFAIFVVNRVSVGMKENRAWLRGEKVVDEEKVV